LFFPGVKNLQQDWGLGKATPWSLNSFITLSLPEVECSFPIVYDAL
jgi:hypothetical protein